MADAPKHSNIPWYIETSRAPKTSESGYNYHIRADDGTYIVEGRGGRPDRNDAQLIVAAVNHHDRLVSALKDLLETVRPIQYIDLAEMTGEQLKEITARARTNIINAAVAIARAEGRQP